MRYNSSGSRKMSKGIDVVDGSSNRKRGGNRVKLACDEWHAPTAIHNIF